MTQPTIGQPAVPMPNMSTLRASAEQIAHLLVQSAGAVGCYLTLVGTAGHHPRLLIMSGQVSSATADMSQVTVLLRRARNRVHPLQIEVHDQPALVLPLCCDDRVVGSALLLFSNADACNQERSAAAVRMAAYALDSARQVAVLHLQAEEIEARARTREIQLSRNLIRSVIDGIPLGLILLDTDGTVLAVNRALSARFDSEPAAMVGIAYEAAIGSWHDSPAAQAFATGVPGRRRRTLTRSDGAQTLLEVASFPLLDAEERPRQVIEVWEDITERVALQTQLVRAEKLAAIGQLAASIAHEVGNPLQAIQGFLSLFLEQCDPHTPNRKFLELAEDEIERIVQVVSRLRDLYRPRADVIASVNLNELVEHVLLLTSKQLERERIRVRRDLVASLPTIRGVPDQIKQVLLNLVLNAAEAMPNGGTLRIRTSESVIEPDMPAVLLALSDTGAGIASEQLPHIFDGLHTTKERGMGLGLYTSKAIIERHMGRITVQSRIGEGTTFTITLPLNAEEGTA